MSQIFKVLSLFFQSLFSQKYRIGRFLLWTGLTGLLLMCILVWAVWTFSTSIAAWLTDRIPYDWAKQSWLFSLVITVFGVYIIYIVFRYLLLILLSPVLSYVSEKTENRISGSQSPARFSAWSAASRSIRVNSRNLLRESTVSLMLLLAGLVPFLSVFSMPALVITQAYFTGFGMMDYYLERHFTFSESVEKVRQHKWASITLGLLFILFLMIPVIGPILGPYTCAVTATRYFCEGLTSEKADIE
jgi:CysZ protein